jgi:hypothetical protein
MRRCTCFTAAICALAAPGTAAPFEQVDCRLSAPCPDATPCASEPVSASFEIDLGQFSPPLLKGDPPRRQVTQVQLGQSRFRAEPIVMDSGVRGFWAKLDGVDHLLTIQPDGGGIYTRTPPGALMTGQCEVSK